MGRWYKLTCHVIHPVDICPMLSSSLTQMNHLIWYQSCLCTPISTWQNQHHMGYLKYRTRNKTTNCVWNIISDSSGLFFPLWTSVSTLIFLQLSNQHTVKVEIFGHTYKRNPTYPSNYLLCTMRICNSELQEKFQIMHCTSHSNAVILNPSFSLVLSRFLLTITTP